MIAHAAQRGGCLVNGLKEGVQVDDGIARCGWNDMHCILTGRRVGE